MKRAVLGIGQAQLGRPPRGGRGLKPPAPASLPAMLLSPPARGAWIETSRDPPYPASPRVAPRAGGVD